MTSPQTSQRASFWLLAAILLAALTTLPLWLLGSSCGHDIAFHTGSWLNAADAFRHGHLFLAWDSDAAWHAGEPRFLFYPPLSWMLGALLTLLLPFSLVPATFTTLVLCAAAASLYTFARRYVSPSLAALAAVLYAANPYMLFTAWERTAFAELLAAVWMPLLLRAALQERPRAWSLAWPLALLWLTNAPAGIIATYALVLIALLRFRRIEPFLRELFLPFLGGLAGGLALAGCYLLPVAFERRFVSLDMAVIPSLSIASNTLFATNREPIHDLVNAQISRIALVLLLITFLALLSALSARVKALSNRLLQQFFLLALIIGFLLTPASLVVWNHLPELAFLQFPWRLLLLLTPIAALLCAGAFPLSPRATLPVAAILACALSFSLAPHYLQGCPIHERPQDVAELQQSSHGVEPTDEYTPHGADNDLLRYASPAWWLTQDPQAPAPGTLPNPNERAPDLDFGTPAPEQTLSHSAPRHLQVDTASPTTLVLNLRAYPRWKITRNGAPASFVQRKDGLFAVILPAGHSVIDIRWQTPIARWIGLLLSVLALAAFAFNSKRSPSRRITV